MVKALFDTNILIDYLNDISDALREFERYDGKAISVIAWMEVLIGARPDLAAPTRDFLESFKLVTIDEAVAEKAAMLRQRHRMKLPDAIIRASAEVHSMLLVTRNTKDFPSGTPGIRVPYTL